MNAEETALEPDRPIIDPHLHLWDIPEIEGMLQEPQSFLVSDAGRIIAQSGHAVTHTVFVECHAMYRQSGPDQFRSLGETEFALGMAAMADSGMYGECRIAHRIIANVDLCRGDEVAAVLDAHLACAGTRLRGVRMNTSFSDAGLFGFPSEQAAQTRLTNPDFIRGARVLADLDLSLDVWCLHPQLPQLIELAKKVPELLIVLNHLGTPDLRGRYARRGDEAFAEWRGYMQTLAELANVRVKISGLGMDVTAPVKATTGASTSTDLADAWHSRVEVAIEAFGAERCMFASNYPTDRSVGSYGAIWNAFKRLANGYTDADKDHLFRRTAAQTYRIDINS